MDMVAPLGPVYQAGTLSGNPLAMAAGITVLCMKSGNRERIYQQLDDVGEAGSGSVAGGTGSGVGFEHPHPSAK